jgi:hypothetical protein
MRLFDSMRADGENSDASVGSIRRPATNESSEDEGTMHNSANEMPISTVVSDAESDADVPAPVSATQARSMRRNAAAVHLRRNRRHAWQELARQMRLVQTFAQLNYVAVHKIMKKVNRLVAPRVIDSNEALKNAEFASSATLDTMLETVRFRRERVVCLVLNVGMLR